MNEFKMDISKAADTLMCMSVMFNCSLKDTWKNHMHPVITDQFTFEEVNDYIQRKVELGNSLKS